MNKTASKPKSSPAVVSAMDNLAELHPAPAIVQAAPVPALPAIDKPGVYELPAERYHADPCVEPSLNATVGKVLVGQTPLHGRNVHPRLNPLAERFDSSALDLGTVAHTLALGTGRDIVTIDADNYTTKDARAARDAARAEGKTPILARVLDEAHCIVSHLEPELKRHGLLDAWKAGVSERVFIWQDEGIWCRCMVDRFAILGNELFIFDYKTAGDIAPEVLQRQIENLGYDLGAAHYTRGGEVLFPDFIGRVRFILLFQEKTAPFSVLPVELDGEAEEIARRKHRAAVQLFKRGLETEYWPSYPSGVLRMGPAKWAASRWIEREQNDPILAGIDF